MPNITLVSVGTTYYYEMAVHKYENYETQQFREGVVTLLKKVVSQWKFVT